MKTRYLNPSSTVIEVSLDPGEAFGNFVCARDATSPFVVPILTEPANDIGDALLVLIAAGKVPVPAPLSQHNDVEIPPLSPGVTSVSKAQGKLALRAAGLLDTVKKMIADTDDEDLLIWWEDASVWDRSSKYISAFATKLGLTDAQVANLFNSAATFKT